MKTIILPFLLLLVACAPSPTKLSPPATSTLTPQHKTTPTALPSSTATPETYQTDREGNVQIFENGKYVNLPPAEGIWSPVDGAKVVLVEDENGKQEAFTQMTLNDFQTPDGAHAVNVLKYNEKTSGWELLPFSFTRSGSENINFSPLNFYLQKIDIKILDQYNTSVHILGLRSDRGSMEIMVLFKGEVKILGLDQTNITDLVFYADPAQASLKQKITTPEDMAASDVVELIDRLNKSLTIGSKSPINPQLHFFVVSAGVTEKDYDEISDYYYDMPRFEEWCKRQVAMGEDRNIPSRSEVDWALMNPQTAITSESSEFPDLNSLWTGTTVLEIEGTFVELQLSKKGR